ncbi:MAG TPA: SLC13 family permease [Thermohalobaculum sp.]|nr:SLC13 family permease [Thermohalobaculum sp.]
MSTLSAAFWVEYWPALFTIGVVGAMFASFVREDHPPEVVAICGAALLLAVGILPVDDLLLVFANPAPITIGAMFILSGALIRTGALDAFSRVLSARVAARPRQVLAEFAGLTAVSSAFMNNTPIVVMMMPVAIRLGKVLHVPASKLLIPLSYTAILGGMCTLIGTSTNLLVDGIVRAHGMEPFTLFEITPVAVIILFVSLAFIGAAAPRFLPTRKALVDFLTGRRKMRFFTEVVIPEGSELIGHPVLEVAHFTRDDMTIVDVIRGDLSLRRRMADAVLAAGDHVVIRTAVGELLSLRDNKALSMTGQIDAVGQKSTVTVEALITPGCRMVGRFLGDLRLRRRYGVYPLAVHRRDERVGAVLDEVRIQVGDTLLLEGDPDDIHRLAEEQGLAELTQPSERPYRRDRAPIVLGILGLVVLGSSFGLMPIAGLAVIGVALALVTRCIDAEEAFQMVEIRLLTLILAMLAVGQALERTGAVELLVEGMAPWLMDLPPQLVLWLVFMMGSLLTELVSNNAVAVVITPVAISLAHALGIDPRPFVIAVMFAASCSFATPIGYQTNTLVYAPGGYRFTDFMRLGIPLNLLVSVLAALLIPLFWEF